MNPQARVLTLEEQKAFCQEVVNAVQTQSADIEVSCVILDQKLSEVESSNRRLQQQFYILTVNYEIESGQVGVQDTIVTSINTPDFQTAATQVIDMPVEAVQNVQQSPTTSPTAAPSSSPTNQPTSSPSSSPTNQPTDSPTAKNAPPPPPVSLI